MTPATKEFLKFLREDVTRQATEDGVDDNEAWRDHRHNLADLVRTRPDLSDLLTWCERSALDEPNVQRVRIIQARMRLIIKTAERLNNEERVAIDRALYSSNPMFGAF